VSTTPTRLRTSLARAVAALVVLCVGAAAPAAAIGSAPGALAPALADLCATGPVDQAAQALLGDGAELVAVDADSALVLTPGVHPGVRSRLVAAGGGAWCPASAINLLPDRGDAVDQAVRAATVLPAAHFDGVTVERAEEVAPGEVHLRTHALTNGVVADWVVQVDAAGVASARWTAAAFAVRPFEPQMEGLTALPGASLSYARAADGTLSPTTDVLAAARAEQDADPSPTISTTAADGFTMHVVVGDATFYPQAANSLAGTPFPRVYGGAGPDAGTDTGDVQVDYLRIMGEALEVNYEDFLSWGFEQGWVDDEGNLYVDGALSAYCLACVLVSEYFNIHMNRGAHEALAALGYRYPDARTALVDIVGHEMVHNIQNAYGKPDTARGARHNSYSEGTARFTETIHDYSDVSHQPRSLVYANDINGCNGWQGTDADAAFAAGPLTGQSYDACYFWMTFHAAYGVDALVALVAGTRGLPSGRPWEVYDEAILAAARSVDPDATLVDVLVNFAAMSLTGRDYTWGAPADPDDPPLDWSEFLDRWTPRDAAVAGTNSATLRDGGIAAFEVAGTYEVTDVSTAAGHGVALVVDDGTTTTVRQLEAGDTIRVGSGQVGWLVLLNAGTAQSQVSATLA
jgi:hypothetical protein